MLCRLGLQFAGARDVGQQRQVDIDYVAARQVVLDLADSFEERQAFDVADSAANLAQHEVVAIVAIEDEVLNGIRHMRE